MPIMISSISKKKKKYYNLIVVHNLMAASQWKLSTLSLVVNTKMYSAHIFFFSNHDFSLQWLNKPKSKKEPELILFNRNYICFLLEKNELKTKKEGRNLYLPNLHSILMISGTFFSFVLGSATNCKDHKKTENFWVNNGILLSIVCN